MEMDQIKQDLSQFPGVIENIPCCFYIAEDKPPHRILYANDEMLRLFDCLNLEEFYRHTEGVAPHLFIVDDREHVEQDIRHELEEKHNRFDHVQGHLFTRTSRIHYADVSGRRVDTETYGTIFYCTLQEIDIPLLGVAVDRDIRDYVISHLDEAIDNHWIQVYYQPVIRTLTGELCGMEALARWVDPNIGFLSPGSFIPVLEQVRLIHRLDTYVLEEVCRMLRQRLDHDMPITPVSFNLSRYDFDMVDIFTLVEDTRKKYFIPRDFLHVEITESALANDAERVHRALDRLRENGYEIWLDDFGSKFSSLNILKDYTVDLIKLDMSFLRSFTEKSRSIINSVITMAKDLNIKTLVEGVETKEHADFLASIGCGRQQGYYYGKPRPLTGTLAHIKAEGRCIEPRKWCHFYDMASMVIRQTDRTCVLFDMQEDGLIRFLYTNKAYQDQCHALGYQLQDIVDNLNQPNLFEISRSFREAVRRSCQSHHVESLWYIDGGKYITAALRVVYEFEHRLLIHLEFREVSSDKTIEQTNDFDEKVRYLYGMFEVVKLVDLQKDTIEPLYFRDKDAQTGEPQSFHGIREFLQQFAEKYVYEEDRQCYLAFSELDTILERIKASPTGNLSFQFRMRDSHGNYFWKECTILLVANGHTPLLLVTGRPINVPALSEGNGDKSVESMSAILWKSLRQNTRLCYFWKDKDRRFLGATKTFLDYYGFSSVETILGKTDEDMNWHVDNDSYRLDEMDVLNKGKIVVNAIGKCIVKGVLHHIACHKWPVYREGKIVGLMGCFFDVDKMYSSIQEKQASPYVDPLTGLHNRQGFLDDLANYQEFYTMEHQDYALILLESRFYGLIQKSYDNAFLRTLIRQEADILRTHAGKDATISRIQNMTFAILRRENDPEVSEAIAKALQQRLQDIHQIEGAPVTITYRYSVVHASELSLRYLFDGNVSHIYRLAMERLRRKY